MLPGAGASLIGVVIVSVPPAVSSSCTTSNGSGVPPSGTGFLALAHNKHSSAVTKIGAACCESGITTKLSPWSCSQIKPDWSSSTRIADPSAGLITEIWAFAETSKGAVVLRSMDADPSASFKVLIVPATTKLLAPIVRSKPVPPTGVTVV